MFKKLFATVLTLTLVFGLSVVAMAQAQQVVGIQVSPINQIAVSGNPAQLVVSTAVAGQQPDPVIDNSTTYAITTNDNRPDGTGGATTQKITAVLSAPLPPNTALLINLVAPIDVGLTAISAGNVPLAVVAADVVTLIDRSADPAKGITYTFSASVAAGVVGAVNATVTLTIASD